MTVRQNRPASHALMALLYGRTNKTAECSADMGARLMRAAGESDFTSPGHRRLLASHLPTSSQRAPSDSARSSVGAVPDDR
jgi:hypothetical protein